MQQAVECDFFADMQVVLVAVTGKAAGSDHAELLALSRHLGVRTGVRAEDLAGGNVFCQRLFAAKVMESAPDLSAEERAGILKNEPKDKKGRAEATLRAWINSVVGRRLQVKNLARDLASGVVLLKLLDRCQPLARSSQASRGSPPSC